MSDRRPSGVPGFTRYSQGYKVTEKSTDEYAALLNRVHGVLADSARTATMDRIDLRDAVCDYVVVERARGTPLSGILLAVKQILRKAEEGSARASDELASQLIAWCLEFHHAVTLR